MKKTKTLVKSNVALIQVNPTQSELTDQFINSQDVRPSSKALYRRTLKQYFSWLHATGIQLPAVTRIEILRYKQDLLDNGLSSLTVGSYLTVVRKFYEWAEGMKYYPNVSKGVKTPTRKQQFRKQPLTLIQGKDLLENNLSGSKRDYAILNLLLRTGIRTIEATRANVGDIVFKGGKRVLLVHGKGRDEKDNFVILTDKAHKSISEYLNTRGKVKAGEPLFISVSNHNSAGRLTTKTISTIAKTALREIGLDSKEYTAHSLRHTTAVNILRQGGTIEDAQGVLRHTSPATTQIYTATIKEEMRLKHAPEELLDSVY